MNNTTYKLGQLIQLSDKRNTDLKYGIDDVKGMTIDKTIIPTKADMSGTDLSKFIIVHPNEFIYNPRTHGKKIGLGFNDSGNNFLISWNNIAFKVKDSAKNIVIPRYLYMDFNRLEWDRRACFDSWGTSTEVFTWDAMCDMEITLPPLSVQKKYVDIYKSMVDNQKEYEKGIDDLKLVCDGFLDKLKREGEKVKIGEFIQQSDIRNVKGELTIENLKGISTDKSFISTKADMKDVSLSNYKIVKQNEFVYVADTSRRGDKIALCINDSSDNYLVSSIYTVFKVKDEQKLNPNYLMMFFTRTEFDRYARFNSWGSARETFDWSEMCEVAIPIPDIHIQESIANIYKVYIERKRIGEQLKKQIKDLCPILIKGSIEEADGSHGGTEHTEKG
ncbi:MAG: restriction endonuclease subunit S [Bacteroidales bacterium]|nr:restriction endonuclease subunit S [Bacteroidales bacterium]